MLVTAWSSFLAYWAASSLYQLGTLQQHPLFSSLWLPGAALAMWAAIRGLKLCAGKPADPGPHIIATSG